MNKNRYKKKRTLRQHYFRSLEKLVDFVNHYHRVCPDFEVQSVTTDIEECRMYMSESKCIRSYYNLLYYSDDYLEKDYDKPTES
jgi:hypothetical protein